MQHTSHPWGESVWSCVVPVTPCQVTNDLSVDVAVVGAGFTGLATAHYILQLCPTWRVAVFEARHVGAGASGRTGGLVLEDTSVGPLPDVGDCIATLRELVSKHSIQCDLRLGTCWEIGRRGGRRSSPIRWQDSGTLRVVHTPPGGTFDPMQFLAGMTTLVQQAGGQIFEQAPVTGLDVTAPGSVRLTVGESTVHAAHAVFGTNAFCLSMLGLQNWAGGVHTIALATEPLADNVFEAIGWATRTPFYTLDLPYLWGRVTAEGRAVIGAGLTGHHNVDNARVDAPDAASLLANLERRVRGLHPALHEVRFTHRWMGPLCFTSDNKPVIARVDHDGRVLVATGYRGHGVALSVRVGKLLAEVLAGKSTLPAWSYQPH